MKNLLFVLPTLFFLCGGPALCQWTLMNSGTTENIEDMYFLNESVGYAITNGSIIATGDGGFNWSVIHTFEASAWPEVSIVTTPDSVFAFGWAPNGSAFKLTAAHGSNDFIQSQMDLLAREPVYFNADIYYVNWLPQSTWLIRYNDNDPLQLVTGVELFNAQGEYLSYSQNWTIHRSNDHGNTWDTLQFHEPFLTTHPFQSFYNGSDTLHAVTNYPAVLHTSHDGGMTWSWMQLPNGWFYYFRDPNRILGTTRIDQWGSYVRSTIDGGYTWHTDTLEHPVRHAWLHEQDISFLYGDNGVIYRSSDPWLPLAIPEVAASELLVMPNPASDHLTVVLPAGWSPTHLELYDLEGRSVRRYPYNTTILSIEGISAGPYMLVAHTSQKRFSTRVMIE
jgi:photosystem II stability/assembly factor-like uncharacterized protein